jgi:hypothetical protein
MLTIINQSEAESLVTKGEEDFRIRIYPNFINKMQLYLTGKASKGVKIYGAGPMAMRAYYSLLDYSVLVGKALKNKYDIYIIKKGHIFDTGDWYLEFRLNNA